MDGVEQLTRAAKDGEAAVVARLLSAGAGVDTPNTARRTALDLAAREGHAETVRLLLAAGADPQQQTGEYDESTPLCQAAMHGHTEVVRVLLDAGAPICAQGRMGHVPLVLAATSGDQGHPQTVDLLLDHGTDIDAVMKDKTSLEWAALFGQVPMVHHLLARGATPTGKALRKAHEHAKRFPKAAERYALIIDALHAAGVED
ncbi:ankyrin repeat domain-containing protein [Streptomyces triticisoli]|jgi:ankyrin repeat protein|uniref:ankyrin repeat domain-containing protein n=1 Tax=Streptomyces triticisoli TaxID=2182797 RepID=UPI000DDBB280|nr:ankyrin repeat domain-containing protein [Streptomyces triticisoli]